MKLFPAILVQIAFIIITSCKQSSSVQEKTEADTIAYRLDTSNQYLYDFIRMVVKDQHLNYDHGFSLTPETSVDVNGNDKSFLRTFLIIKERADIKKASNSTKVSTDSSFISSDTIITIQPSEIKIDFNVSSGPFVEKCLTEQDISYMLSERDRLKDFVWDNHRLGFNLANENNWYEFSLPYFTRDRKTAVILVRDLCKPFLCGSGYTLLYRYKDGRWTSSKTGSWIH